MTDSCGILYVASNSSFRDEAIVSARSVKSVWPDIPIAIITDEPVDRELFNFVKIVKMEGGNIDKVRCIAQSPFQRTVLLDTDTYCLAAFPEVFDLLDRFDMAVAHDTGRFTQRWDSSVGDYVFIYAESVPECFPEFNTGVIVFRSEPQVLQVFERWLNTCREVRQGATPHLQDQPSFRRVVYNSNLRIATLPSEYNFRLSGPDCARTEIKVIHGRWTYSDLGLSPEATYANLGRICNGTIGPRVHVHAFGIISGHGPLCIPLDESYAERELIFKETDGVRCEVEHVRYGFLLGHYIKIILSRAARFAIRYLRKY